MEWSRSRELLLGRGGKKRPQQKRHQSGHHLPPDREQRGDTGVQVRGREQGDVTEDRGRRAGTLSTVGQGTVCGWVVPPPIVTS